MIGRVIDGAEKLIKTCDAYFQIVQQKDTLAIENKTSDESEVL